MDWRYFDPQKAPTQEMWKWSVDRKYPTETLDWTQESWSLDERLAGNEVGYTLRSLKMGPSRIYENLYQVITDGADPIVKLSEIRPQIEIMEKALAQNPLPRK